MNKHLTCHDTYIRKVELPRWNYFQPVCLCGWLGHIHRGRYRADEEINAHHVDIAPPPVEQPLLPGFDTPTPKES